MSTTYDDGMFGAGPSMLRAFLHALARKLARLGHSITHRTRKVLRVVRAIPRKVAEATATTITAVFRRSGFEAAVGLLIAGGQIIRYATRYFIQTVGGLIGKVTGWLGRRIHRIAGHPIVRHATSRIIRAAQQPTVAVVVIGVALVATAVVGWIGIRGRSESAAGPEATVTRLVTTSSRSWTVSQDSLDQLMAHLFVILGSDGSVRVHGIPEGWPKKTRETVAKVAAVAAEQRLESLVARGRPLTPVDLQAVNVAARSAVARRFNPTGEVA